MHTHRRGGGPNDLGDLARRVVPVVVEHQCGSLLRRQSRESVEKLDSLTGLRWSRRLVTSGSCPGLQFTRRDPKRCDPDPPFGCAQGGTAAYGLRERLCQRVIGDPTIACVGDEGTPKPG